MPRDDDGLFFSAWCAIFPFFSPLLIRGCMFAVSRTGHSGKTRTWGGGVLRSSPAFGHLAGLFDFPSLHDTCRDAPGSTKIGAILISAMPPDSHHKHLVGTRWVVMVYELECMHVCVHRQ